MAVFRVYQETTFSVTDTVCALSLIFPVHLKLLAAAEMPGAVGWPSVPGTHGQLPPQLPAESAFLPPARASSEVGMGTSEGPCFQKQPSPTRATFNQRGREAHEQSQPPFL